MGLGPSFLTDSEVPKPKIKFHFVSCFAMAHNATDCGIHSLDNCNCNPLAGKKTLKYKTYRTGRTVQKIVVNNQGKTKEGGGNFFQI
jgi:hypothetical protein